MDWNDDGKKDLITGEADGHVRVYLNVNTDKNPVFTGYTFIEVGGFKFSQGYASTPHVVDWNNDGKKDLLCGEGYGKVDLLLNIGTNAVPLFNAASPLKCNNVPIDVGYGSSPTVADWNRDGKKDLLVAHSGGTVYYFENQGTDEDPLFTVSMLLQAGGSPMKVGYDAHLDVLDWDGDGVWDIIYGNSPGTVFYFHALGPLQLDKNRIEESIGERIHLHLDAGSTHASRKYLMLGSLSGTAPGITLPGDLEVLPLNWDVFTDLTLLLVNTPVFDSFLGMLDANGEADAYFDTLGPVPGAAGIRLWFAYGLNNPWDFVSNPAQIEVVP